MSKENQIQLEKIYKAKDRAIIVTDSNRAIALTQKIDLRNQFSRLGINIK